MLQLLSEVTFSDMDRARADYPRHQQLVQYEKLPMAAPEREPDEQ